MTINNIISRLFDSGLPRRFAPRNDDLGNLVQKLETSSLRGAVGDAANQNLHAASNSKKNLTIIITTFNSEKVILQCLNKINFARYDVIVVDNNSQDQTTNIIEQNFSQAKLIKLTKNIGYGRANNVALRQTETDFAMILNPDAFIPEENIETILNLMQKKPKIALAGPLLMQHYPIQEDDKIKQLKIVDSNLITRFDEYLSVKYIIGAILFLKMSVFKQIGFFDENIFLYYEDDEISWRTIQNGYQAAIIPDAHGFHIGQGSSGGSIRSTYKRFWHRALSKLYWKEKRKGKLIAIKSAVRLVIVFLIKSLFYIIICNPKKAVANFASCLGSSSFLIGLKAFDKNDNPRG
jgi:N-acetylglucosaminyl-diphospho-decaprenol L-rhamnosyltransferase